MIKYKTIKVETKEIDSIRCDKCLKVFDKDDFMEVQEMHTVDFVGGYSSVFGDGAHVQCHLCQDCLYKMIRKCCNYIEDDWNAVN